MRSEKAQRDEKILAVMVAEAIQSPPYAHHRLRAEIWRDGERISEGFNNPASHPVAKRYAKNDEVVGMCAEKDAVIRLIANNESHLIPGSVLYVARVKKNRRGGPFVRGGASPCQGCLRMAEDFGFRRIVWTEDWGSGWRELTKRKKS